MKEMNKKNLLSLLTVVLCFWFSAAPTLFAQETTEVEIPLLPKEPIEVIVEGVEAEELKNVQAALAFPPGLASQGKVDRLWLERFQRQVPEKVRLALEPFGYYESGVTVSLEQVDQAFRLHVKVERGKPVRVKSVKVEVMGPGAGERVLKDLVVGFPLKEGDRFRHQKYEEAKGNLKTQALNSGYLDAEFSTHTISVSRAERSADIRLIMETGPQYYFGDMRVVGASQYPDRFLKRYIEFRPGEVFSYPKIFQTQLNFNNSDRFAEVVILPEKEAAQDHRVPVEIRLEPSKPKRLRIGAGYATDTGARITSNYQDLNFYGRGHELYSELNLSERLQTFVTRYVRPSMKDLDSYTSFKVGINHEETKSYENRSIFLEPEYTRSLSRGRMASLYVQARREDFTVGEDEGRSRLVMPGLRFSKRRYDDLIHPHQGYQYGLDLRGTHAYLGSDSDFLQLLFHGSFILPLPLRLSLLTRAQGGFTLLSDPLRDLPASVRFFAGGDRSIRGYAYQSQGPQDDAGNVVGGRHLLVGSIELERALWKHWGVAAFCDAGNAFNTFKSFDPIYGVGLGLRLYTPVGPIRLDIARQVGVKDPDFRIHLTVGFVL